MITSDAKLHPDCPASSDCPPIDPALHNLWHEGRFEECGEGLRAVLADCPSCPRAIFQLISCLASLERYGEADQLLEELLPDANDDRQLASLCTRKGRIILECFGPSEAEPWLRQASELEDYEGYLVQLAEALWKRGRRKAAADLAEQALSKMPYDPFVINNCVAILVKSGPEDRAQELVLELANVQYKLPHFRMSIAFGMIRTGLRRKGLALGKRVAKMHPESVSIACNLTHLLHDADRNREAAPLLRRLLKLDPAGHGKFALMNLTLISAEEGNVEDMLRWAVRANVEFSGADTQRLLKNTIKIVSSQVREREAAVQKLNADYARVSRKQESLEASLAGYDLTEGGTNLEYALADGEGWHIEFKECMPDQARDLGIEIAALSSQRGGGTIFLGVRDNGEVVGIQGVETLKDRDQWRHRIAQIATKIVQPPNPVTVYFNERDGLDVIKIWVPEGSAPIYYVGHIAYIRNLDESRKATPEEIAEYVSRRSITGDRNGH